MKERDQVVLYALLDEMVARMDVFCPGVVFRVFCQGFGTFVVDVYWNGGVWAKMQFGEKMTEPQSFLAQVGECFVLRLRAGK
jgi:hypothetical protein